MHAVDVLLHQSLDDDFIRKKGKSSCMCNQEVRHMLAYTRWCSLHSEFLNLKPQTTSSGNPSFTK